METKNATSGTTKNSDISNSCRVCMMEKLEMNDIFDAESDIVDKILYCTGLQFSKDDGLPSQLCHNCTEDLSIAHKFKSACLLANETFQDLLKTIKTEVDVAYEGNFEEFSDEELHEEELFEETLNENKIDNGFTILEVKPKKRQPYKRTNKPRRLLKLKFRRLWCEQCSVKFQSKDHFEEHKSRYHKEGEKKVWVCEMCGKVFGTRGSLSSHIRSHLPPRFACDQCDYKTCNKFDLKKHVFIHKGVKLYQCAACPASYHTSSNLASHVRRCHDKEKRFSCSICELKFFDNARLRRHLDSHNNIKRFECEVCHTCFARRSYWKKHLLKQHNVQVPRKRPGQQKVNLIVNAPDSTT